MINSYKTLKDTKKSDTRFFQNRDAVS